MGLSLGLNSEKRGVHTHFAESLERVYRLFPALKNRLSREGVPNR